MPCNFSKNATFSEFWETRTDLITPIGGFCDNFPIRGNVLSAAKTSDIKNITSITNPRFFRAELGFLINQGSKTEDITKTPPI